MFASNQNKYIITKSDKTGSKIVIKKKDLPSDKKKFAIDKVMF
jgi:hypothetical protein